MPAFSMRDTLCSSCHCSYPRYDVGRTQFFDLHDMFVRWVNLPQCKNKKLDYSQFLQILGKFEDIPEQEKVRKALWDG